MKHLTHRLAPILLAITTAQAAPAPWSETRLHILAREKSQLIQSTALTLQYLDTLAGHPVVKTYWFSLATNTCEAIDIQVQQLTPDPQQLVQIWPDLRDTLTRNYQAPPIEETTKWTDDTYRLDPARHGQALAAGHLIQSATWHTPDADILMILSNIGDGPALKLMLLPPTTEQPPP